AGETPPATPPAPAEPTGPAVDRRLVGTLVATGHQSVEFTNDDGQIAAWVLDEPQYRARVKAEGDAPPSEVPFRFVDLLPEKPEPHQKGIFLPPLIDLQLAGAPALGEYTVAEQSKKSLRLVWTDPQSGVEVTRSYTLGDSYTVNATVTLKNPGATAVPYDLSARLRGAQNDSQTGGGLFSPPIYLFEVVCKRAEKFERLPAKKIVGHIEDNEPVRWTDGIGWAGVDNRYFMTALAAEPGALEACEAESSREGVPPGYTRLTARVDMAGGEIAPGASVERTVTLYAGPKKLSDLRTINPPLDSAIDFGFFSVICVPMLWLMRAFYGFVGNWGVAIVLLTLLVKLLTLPLTFKQYKSMAAMKILQPQMKALQAKYKEDKVKLQQEMMKLYREHKVNPLAGCLPMVMMMPIYFALYRTIYSAVELYQADLGGWIHDLSQPDPTYITPLVLGVLMFVQMRLNPSAGDQAQQKILQYMMPVMFTVMMLWLPSGLVVYILVNTLLGIGQQYYMYRRPQAAPAKG
ncbi:MAG: membrane protein insertase YidC, partial [Myxococcales bacterium]|nr:membrane protein insertase YidC [Myxococcales bacterium]